MYYFSCENADASSGVQVSVSYSSFIKDHTLTQFPSPIALLQLRIQTTIAHDIGQEGGYENIGLQCWTGLSKMSDKTKLNLLNISS